MSEIAIYFFEKYSNYTKKYRVQEKEKLEYFICGHLVALFLYSLVLLIQKWNLRNRPGQVVGIFPKSVLNAIYYYTWFEALLVVHAIF